MQAFTTLTAIAAPLPIDNVDTDMIIPKQFLKTIKRTGLKEGLFYEMRYTEQGEYIADFVLHNPPYTQAEIIISGQNFGCGSSREHAPWALLDFGIRAVIAPGFADIFFNNCFKNGILPIVLAQSEIDSLMEHAATHPMVPVTIDLSQQIIRVADSIKLTFNVEPFRKHCLLNGLDDIGLTLAKTESIDAFEQQQKNSLPWLYT